MRDEILGAEKTFNDAAIARVMDENYADEGLRIESDKNGRRILGDSEHHPIL